MPSEPVISPCKSHASDVCDIDEDRRLVMECSVTRAFPRPTLTWSLIECSEDRNKTQRWFVSNQVSTFDKLYNVSSEIYLGELRLEEDEDCSFECEATGDSVVNGYSTQTVVVTGNCLVLQ